MPIAPLSAAVPVRNPTDYAAATEAFARLLRLMDELRENCPWDQKQTTESIRHLSLEEVHELSDAILNGDAQEVRKEVGDLLLHVVFYARMAREAGQWDVPDLIHGLCDKLVRRHPHIYGTTQVDGAGQVIQNWEAIKQQERATTDTQPTGVLHGVPNSLPSLLKAYRMQEKAAAVGFDWPTADGVLDKLTEELGELQAELNATTVQTEHAEDELGDVLFSLVNWARWHHLNPEDALERTNRKFRTRFAYLEEQARATGKPLRDHTLAELEAWWQQAKTV